MMLRSLVLVATLLGVAHSQTPVDYESCGGATDQFQVGFVGLSPFPPRLGQNLTFYLYGSTIANIDEEAVAVIEVEYTGVPVFRQQYQVCEWVRDYPDLPQQCPQLPGSDMFLYASGFFAAPVAPTGFYDVVMYANTALTNGQPLFCVRARVEILPELK